MTSLINRSAWRLARPAFLVGTALAALANAGPAMAQDATSKPAAAATNAASDADNQAQIVIIGSRREGRTVTDLLRRSM